MAINTLSLPVDIPWKLIAISEDLFAKPTDLSLPVKWHASLAVFAFEPKLDPELAQNDGQEIPGEITTYLKVVASITGFQPTGEELDASVWTGTFKNKVIKNYEQLTDHYYPALSALVQVAVLPLDRSPDGQEWSIDQYPYLADFEPKKRELVELVTDSGEILSKSSNTLNVRKGTTSANTTEMDNFDKGLSFNQAVQAAGFGGATAGSFQKEVGTRSILGSNVENLITTDASREKRESFSHTTNLAQLYQLLDSYHTGTNRAVFFLNARPHILQSPFTFVNGPRQLEGIQEFFLVVRRPKIMVNFCVKASLETAHLHQSDTKETTGQTRYERSQQNGQLVVDAQGSWVFWEVENQLGQITISIPTGYHLDQSRGGTPVTLTFDPSGRSLDFTPPKGVDVTPNQVRTDGDHELDAVPNITAYDDHVDVRAQAYGWYAPAGSGDTNSRLNYTITVYTVSNEPVETPSETTVQHADLFIAGREVSSCQLPASIPVLPYIAYEQELDPQALQNFLQSHQIGEQAVIAANWVNRYVRERVIASFRPSQRYAPGELSFLHTRFATRDLLAGNDRETISQVARPVYSSEQVPAELRRRIEETAPDLTIGEALTMDLRRLAVRLETTQAEARQLRSRLAGLPLDNTQPETRQTDEAGYQTSRIQTRIPGSYIGRGPRAYQRPDARIIEDVNDALTMHSRLDAIDIEVHVDQGVVILTGTVASLKDREIAEETARNVAGVRQVVNRLQAKSGPSPYSKDQ